MKFASRSLVASALLALSASASAATVQVIDLFDSPTLPAVQVLTDTDMTADFSQYSSGLNDILGGYRDLGVQTTSSTVPAVRNASIAVASGSLSFSTASQSQGIGMVRWDGSHAATSFDASDVNTTGLGGVDLGDFASSSFELEIIQADGDFTFVLTAWTDSTHWSQITFTGTEHLIPTTESIPYIAFLDCANVVPGPVTVCGADGAVDFSNVGALEAKFISSATGVIDLSINSVTSVPEPGSLALAGLALTGLAFARRRSGASQ